MRRTFIALVLALGVLGCSDTITPPSAPSSLQADVITQGADIRSQINALVPSGGARTAALTLFDNVEKAWTAAPQRTQAARQQAAALCKMIEKLDEQHKLLAAPAPTTAATLCSALNTYVAGVSGDDAVAQFVPADASEPIVVVVPSYKAGVKIPPGAFGQDVTVIITKIDVPPGGLKPLAADQNRQYPYFFEFQTIPVVPHFVHNVIAGVCTDEDVAHPASRLRLAHNVTVGTSVQLEVFEPVFADFLNFCEPPVGSFGSLFEPLRDRNVLSSPRQLLAAGAKVARDVGSRVLREAGPSVAFATNISLGGASGSFSPFGGYDIGTGSASSFIDFETYPATAAAGPTPTCARCIVTNEYASQGVVFSWESTTFPSPTYGTTLTSNSWYNDASASPPNHIVTWSIDPNGDAGQSGKVRMTFAGQPTTVEYDRAIGPNGSPVTVVTDGLGSTTSATTTVTPLGTFPSIGGFTFTREHVRIVAAQGIASIVLDMVAGTGQTLDNLALNPGGTQLFGVNAGNDGLSALTLGASTVSSTFLGRLGGTDLNSFITPVALAARPSDGALFAWNNSGLSGQGGALVQVDRCTGAGTVVGTASGTLAGALAFSPGGTLYSVTGTLVTVNTTTGALTPVGVTPMGLNINGLAFSPSGVLYGLELQGLSPSVGPRLVTIDLVTGIATIVGALPATTGTVGDMTFTPGGTLIVSVFNSSLVPNTGGDFIFDLDPSLSATNPISNIRQISGGSSPQGMAFSTSCSS